MFVVAVTILVHSADLAPFIAATLDNARHTRQEPANLRFDVLRTLDDPTRFLLYEAYLTPEDFALHQKTAHYLRWKEAVAPMMREPRVGLKHTTLFFGDAEA